MLKRIFIIIWLFVSSFAVAQTFEVDQIEQLFRPRLRFDSKYIFDSKFSDTTGSYNHKEVGAVVTFPIKTKLSADINLDLSKPKLKDILQKSVRIKALQILGVVRVNGRQANLGFDSIPQKNLYGVTAGVLGVRLTKKYRVLFYSLTTSIAEQDKTLNKIGPRFSGILGQLHIRGLKKNFFYGVAATYSDGLFIPAPFLGGSQPIGNHFIFNYTLPVQLNIQYKDNKKTLVTLGVSADGYRSGIEYKTKRLNVTYTSGVGYLNFRYKFTNSFLVRAEGGYVFYQNIRYSDLAGYKTNYPLSTGPYVQVGFNVLFGQTIWEKVIGAIGKNQSSF